MKFFFFNLGFSATIDHYLGLNYLKDFRSSSDLGLLVTIIFWMSSIVCMNHTNSIKETVVNLKSSTSIQHQFTNLQIKHLIKFQNTFFYKQEISWCQCRHTKNISYNSFLHTNIRLKMTTSSTTPSRYTILSIQIVFLKT